MGRITIFSADGCPHSKRTAAALTQRNIPFVSISITEYPEKRQDMIALSHHISTPQVFFNTRHVGGADETIALLEQWDTDKRHYPTARHRFQAEIERHYDPANPRFAIPEYESRVRVENGPPRGPQEYSIRLPWKNNNNRNGVEVDEKATVLETMETLKQILPLGQNMTGPRGYGGRFTVYRNVFTGQQAVQAIATHYNVSTCEAIKLGIHLLQENVLVPAISESSPCSSPTASPKTPKPKQQQKPPKQPQKQQPQKQKQKPNQTAAAPQFNFCPSALYRLQCYAEPAVLNSYRVWKEDLQGVDPAQLLYHLNNLMGRIFSGITNDMGQMDYLAGRAHPLYPIFEEAICALQLVKLQDMKDSATKLAFGINLYNLMIKYALIKVGAADSDYNRLLFYNRISFNVGGLVYNFQEWENGILRGNRKAPYALSVPFAKDDPRLAFIIPSEDVDGRLHFALNCGAKSCPPVNFYTAQQLDHELRLAAAAFCEDDDHVRLDLERGELHLSKIFAWYKQDFVVHKHHYPQVLVNYLYTGLKKQQMQRIVDAATMKQHKVSHDLVKAPLSPKKSSSLSMQSSSSSSSSAATAATTASSLKIVFAPYDWSVIHAKQVATFSVEALKTKERSLIKSFTLKKQQQRRDSAAGGTTADVSQSQYDEKAGEFSLSSSSPENGGVPNMSWDLMDGSASSTASPDCIIQVQQWHANDRPHMYRS